MKYFLVLTFVCFFSTGFSQQRQSSQAFDTAEVHLSMMAREITQNVHTHFEKAKILLEWIHQRLKWLPTDYKSRTVNDILIRGGGNCFELAKVYMTLMHALAIQYRPIAELNIHKESQQRQDDAEKRVRAIGYRGSVFGKHHNDHRWVEIYNDQSKVWEPVDPSMNVIGTEQWVKARLGFEQRVTLDTAITNPIIAPFAIFVPNGNKDSMGENKSRYYLVEVFNRIYRNQLQNLPSWKLWTKLVDTLQLPAKNAFAGKQNLHEYEPYIVKLEQVYLALKKEYSSFGRELQSFHNNLIVHANSRHAAIRINQKKALNWGLNPSLKPDEYEVPCKPGKITTLTFITDIDSAVFNIRTGTIKDFIVVINGKDSAYTRLKGVNIPDAATFSLSYIKNNRNTVKIAIPVVKELLQIIFCITPTGLADTRSFIINHDTTDYYLRVLEKFLPYKEHPIVFAMDTMLKKGHYINLKADACAFKFVNGKIILNGVYHRHNTAGNNKNYLLAYTVLLEDFAKKTGFQKFYTGNKIMYDSLIQRQEMQVPLKKMWDWCEKQFPYKYDAYKVYFSPLVKGNHSTNHAENNGFKETTLFIRGPYVIKNVSRSVQEALLSRVAFTEIDHNYVNPETDKYLEEVNQIFNNRELWTNGKESNGYRDPYNLFNEYMTWALFSLYCFDNYATYDFEIIHERTVQYMTNVRGFTQFKSFTEELLRLYKAKENHKTVASLYPGLLKWCKKLNPIT